jgi:hypothetical protein
MKRRQWYMPAGFHPDGRPASFSHVVDPSKPTVDGDQLTDDERCRLTLLRLWRQKALKLGSLGDGVVDRDRAMREVEARTPLGLALVDIEQRAIRLMREYAEARAVTKKKKKKTTTRRRKTRR